MGRPRGPVRQAWLRGKSDTFTNSGGRRRGALASATDRRCDTTPHHHQQQRRPVSALREGAPPALPRSERIARKRQSTPTTETSLFAFIERQRSFLKAASNDTSHLETQLELAKAYRTTLTARHQIAEKREVESQIQRFSQEVQDWKNGALLQQFELHVAPFQAAAMTSNSSEVSTTRRASETNSIIQAEMISAWTQTQWVTGDGRAPNQTATKQPAKTTTTTTTTITDPVVFTVDEDMCTHCGTPLRVMATEAILGCTTCGHVRPYLQATPSRIPYGEEVEFVTFSYKRQNHFQEWLNSIQAKENTEVSANVIDDVMRHLFHTMGIISDDQITQATVRLALKQLGLRKQYDHTMQIFVSITGKQPPRFSAFQEEQLRIMFEAIQGPFHKHCPPDRKNFLSYSYCLYKFCELTGYDHFMQYFMLLKGAEKLRKQDAIFEKICEEMDWQFIPSIKTKADVEVLTPPAQSPLALQPQPPPQLHPQETLPTCNTLARWGHP